MAKRRLFRWAVRLTGLVAALFFVIGGPLPAWMEWLIPALSPLTLLAESLAQRTWYAGLFWGLPALAVLALALWKGRFFCQWLCPLGTLYALPPRFGPPKILLRVRWNALIFWIIVAASAMGLPALLFLDPLSTFSRIGAWTAWVPGLLIPFFLLLSFFQPQIWCTHFCPLGYLFDLAALKTSRRVFDRDRRQLLAGIGLGIPAALLLPRLGKKPRPPSVLPPGATEQFAETCTRCYACVSACPAQIIRVKSGGGLTELFMPELCFDNGICEESCNQCTQVCPTGAIRRLTHPEKHRTQIGLARIQKGKCLAWADGEHCMVCDEYCPYRAIATEWKDEAIPCPVILADLCRGCGACENACPATRAGKAVFVHPRHPQTLVSSET
jgi:ferredoxin-type protein NapF